MFVCVHYAHLHGIEQLGFSKLMNKKIPSNLRSKSLYPLDNRTSDVKDSKRGISRIKRSAMNTAIGVRLSHNSSVETLIGT